MHLIHKNLEVWKFSIELVEIDTKLVISERLKYCSLRKLEELEILLNRILAMITALIKRIKNKI